MVEPLFGAATAELALPTWLAMSTTLCTASASMALHTRKLTATQDKAEAVSMHLADAADGLMPQQHKPQAPLLLQALLHFHHPLHSNTLL